MILHSMMMTLTFMILQKKKENKEDQNFAEDNLQELKDQFEVLSVNDQQEEDEGVKVEEEKVDDDWMGAFDTEPTQVSN